MSSTTAPTLWVIRHRVGTLGKERSSWNQHVTSAPGRQVYRGWYLKKKHNNKKSNNNNPPLSACQFPPSFPLSRHRKLRILKGKKAGSGEGNSQTMKSQHQPNIKHRPWKRAALDVSGIWQLWLRLPEMDGWSQEHDWRLSGGRWRSNNLPLLQTSHPLPGNNCSCH